MRAKTSMRNNCAAPGEIRRLVALAWVGLLLQGFFALAQAPSNITRLPLACTITSGNSPFASSGYFYVYPTTGSNFYIVAGSTNVASGLGVFTSYARSSANLASARFSLQSGELLISGVLHLSFSTYRSGTFYITTNNHPGIIQAGTFTCSGTAMAAYDFYQYYQNQAISSSSQTTDPYLAYYLYCYHYAYARYHYIMWDTGDSDRAVAAYHAYRNTASNWLNKYNYNRYYNYFSTLSATYYANLLTTNARQANYYKNLFLAYAYYYYWMRQGNPANASTAYNYFLNLSKTFS